MIPSWNRGRSIAAAVILATVVLATVVVAGQDRPSKTKPRTGAQPATGPRTPPDQLVRLVVRNEVNSTHDNVAMMFRVRKETPKGTQTREYVETKDGTTGMLIAVDDKPISAEQRQQEFSRLESLLHNASELRKKQKQQKDDTERVVRMVSTLPDAFIYDYDGTQVVNGTTLVRLKFRPNPDFSPPAREQQVFTGMNGFLLIDPEAQRIARIDGTLFKDVSFGWGILGRLNRGGRFVVVQGPVVGGYWTTTHMQLSFTGKALLFKTITIQSTEDSSGFQRIPSNLTFAQGVELLKKAPAELAANHRNSRSQE